jgi:23S rRNA (uracil1939-C5)-methyltransferase
LNAVCRHFGTCGGCTLQNLSADAYQQHKRSLIVSALEAHGIRDVLLLEIITVPPRSRRRATFKIAKINGETRVGFHALRSHDLVQLDECHVLTPALFSMAQSIPALMSPWLRDNDRAEIYVVKADNGFDLATSGLKSAASFTANLARAAPRLNVVRITVGNELAYNGGSPQIAFGRAQVTLPPRAFLQPTREGEALLQARVLEAVGAAKKVVDLFSGCGTFSLRLAERAQAHAIDTSAPMLGALGAAARGTPRLKPVSTETRDLFKHPLTPAELARFDAAVLDPPRAGALAQAQQLAKSRIGRIAYVSCDAASFARDARVLLNGGFQLDWMVGVDQFLWSDHIEFAGAFSRN